MICQMATIGEALQEEMRAKNIKKSELARLSKVDPGSITRILRDEREPLVRTFAALVRALEIPPERTYRIMNEISAKSEAKETMDEIVFGLKQLPKHEIEDIQYLIGAKLKRYGRKKD